MSADRASLVPLVQAFHEAAPVLVIGDLMLDRFVHGSVERISPEAPIPVFRVEDETAMLGGAGNVVRNLSALGAACRFVTAVGDDAAGREVRALLDGQDGTTATCLQEPGRRTTIKTRYLAGGQQMLRADQETVAPVAPETQRELVSAVEEALEDCAVVVLSDYGKGVLCPAVAGKVIERARAKGRPVIVDPKGTDYAIYAGASLVTPNRKELAEAARLPVGSDTEITAAARHLMASCSIEAVLATRSQDGMTLVCSADSVHHLPAEAREVFDVSGAGDTVVATLAAGLAAGAELPRAAAVANVAAGIAVGKVGTAAVYAADLVAGLVHHDLSEAEHRVATLEQALDRVARWRRRGFKVGFTNGCFDLLHPGHVSLLGQARSWCDRLVVGLNSDASVKRLKGETRPVQAEASRATVLSSLADVDLVVIFDEDTPLKVIEALRPDVLVKGADYTVDTVVGADVVQAAGGEVKLARLEEGHSTTGTISRLNGPSD